MSPLLGKASKNVGSNPTYMSGYIIKYILYQFVNPLIILSIASDYFTIDKIREVLKGYNNILHNLLANGHFPLIITHNLKDPRKFSIVKDNIYDNNKLEGASLVFETQDEFKRVFPEFFAPPPVHVPTNMEQDPETGELRAKHKDPYPISHVQALSGKIILDMGSDIDIGAVWIQFASNDNPISIAVSTEEQYNKGKKFGYISHLINKEHIHEESYNLSKKEDELVRARYILIVTEDRIDNVNVTKAKVLEE